MPALAGESKCGVLRCTHLANERDCPADLSVQTKRPNLIPLHNHYAHVNIPIEVLRIVLRLLAPVVFQGSQKAEP
jgi:hypothetical protein